MSRSLKAHLSLVAMSLVWGATFVVIKSAVADISPLLFNAIRMSCAALILALAFHRHLPGMKLGAIQSGGVAGFFLYLGNELQTTGLRYTTASKSAFLTGVSVVLVPVFLALFWRRGLNRWSVAGVALAFGGLYLLTVPSRPGAGLNLSSLNRGDLYTLGAAVSFAFHIIVIGHVTREHRWQQITVIQVIVTALLMVVTAAGLETPQVAWTGRVYSGIAITACLSLALAFAVQAWAQQYTPPTHAALIFSLEPVFAWVTSFLFLGERLGSRAALGAACILAGVLISEQKGSAESIGVPMDHASVREIVE
ncbi:MAG TPA: DMT family transporter [Terriglobales bacterium]|nr:DMT family transporter [Terriglobales bacterium]